MENNFFENIKNKIKEKGLTDHERSVMRDHLLTYAREHPVGVLSGWVSSFWHIPRGAVLVVAIMAVTGLTYAAEPSLPGDFLYPLKVDVTERVKGVLITSPVERAHYEIALVDKRLTEAETLAVQGKLDKKAVQVIEDKIDEHTDTVKEHVETIKQEDKREAVNVAGQLADSLAKHEATISVIESATAKVAENTETKEDTTRSVNTGELSAKIQEKAESASRDKTDLENEILFDPENAPLTDEEEKKLDDEASSGTDTVTDETKTNIEMDINFVDPKTSLPPAPSTSVVSGSTASVSTSLSATVVPISPTPSSPFYKKFLGR